MMNVASADKTFVKACELRDAGYEQEAFELFLRVAKAGHSCAQVNLGFMFDMGEGVEKNREKALQWYRNAARRGEASAAHNIGTIYRDEGKMRLSLRWFKKAVELGSSDSLLEIAKLYADALHEPQKARQALDSFWKENTVSEVCEEEARRLALYLA